MNRARRIPLAVLAALALSAAGCAVNPVTGKHEISLVTPDQEAALGREGYTAAVAEYGVYDDPALAAYVDSVGRKVARASELDLSEDLLQALAAEAARSPRGAHELKALLDRIPAGSWSLKAVPGVPGRRRRRGKDEPPP